MQRQISGKEQSAMTQNGQRTVKLHPRFNPCHVSFDVTGNTFLILQQEDECLMKPDIGSRPAALTPLKFLHY